MPLWIFPLLVRRLLRFCFASLALTGSLPYTLTVKTCKPARNILNKMSPPGPITLVIQMRCVQMYRQSICKVDAERGQNWAQASETKGTARGHSLQSPKPPRGGAVGRGTLGPRRPAEGSEKSTCLAWTWLGRGAGGRSGAPAAGGGTKPGTVPTPTFIESIDGCCGGGTQPSAPRQAPAPTSGLSRLEHRVPVSRAGESD